MNTDLFPKYVERLGQSYILWFENPNTYILLSEDNYKLFVKFLDSKNEQEFYEYCRKELALQYPEIELLSERFSQLIDNTNSPAYPFSKVDSGKEYFDYPKFLISKKYSYNNRYFSVNFGSEILLDLFHWPLHHLQIDDDLNADTVFGIFKKEDLLYLTIDNKLVFNCPTNQYHYMQGHFSMEITNFIHEKTISNWLATFHASTVGRENSAIMIVGGSGNGKSTLTSLLTANGFDLLADDFTPFYADDMNLYRFPNGISIKPGAFGILEEYIENFHELPSFFNNNKQISVKYYSPKTNSQTLPNKYKCDKIILVKFSPGENQYFSKVPAEKVLATLIPDSWISPHPMHSKKFLSWLKEIDFYDLNYSENEFAISNILKIS